MSHLRRWQWLTTAVAVGGLGTGAALLWSEPPPEEVAPIEVTLEPGGAPDLVSTLPADAEPAEVDVVEPDVREDRVTASADSPDGAPDGGDSDTAGGGGSTGASTGGSTGGGADTSTAPAPSADDDSPEEAEEQSAASVESPESADSPD